MSFKSLSDGKRLFLAPPEVVLWGRFRICLLSTLLHPGWNNRECPVKRDDYVRVPRRRGKKKDLSRVKRRLMRLPNWCFPENSLSAVWTKLKKQTNKKRTDSGWRPAFLRSHSSEYPRVHPSPRNPAGSSGHRRQRMNMQHPAKSFCLLVPALPKIQLSHVLFIDAFLCFILWRRP